MAEYIERDKAIKALIGWETDPTDEDIEYTLNKIPAADVVEVVHGEWIGHEGYEECNICHHKAMFEHNYCPNCGAKMDGERKDTSVRENEKP